MTREDFIKRAELKHGKGTYGYGNIPPNVKYTDYVAIVCPTHGEFSQRAGRHYEGGGCSRCYDERRGKTLKFTNEDFIKRAKEAHGDYYDYSKVKYKNQGTKVEIVCPEHGVFWQRAGDHILGRGCRECGKLKITGAPSLSPEEYFSKARDVHKNFYDYSVSEYTTMRGKLNIRCPEHGLFSQVAAQHVGGAGCPECGRIKAAPPRLSHQEYLSNLKNRRPEVFEKYYLTKLKYEHGRGKVIVTCPKHGDFDVYPHPFLIKGNCPSCATIVSRPHQQVLDWLDELGVDYLYNYRKLIPPKEVDVYLPEYKLAIEIDGEWWHRHQNLGDKYYHYNKFKECEEAGVKLMQFWGQTDVMEKPEIVKSMIFNALGKNSQRVYARQTEVVELTPREYREFMETNHLEGGKNSSIKLGLNYNGELVSALGFSRRGEGWELDRFANRLFTSVVGGFSRLMSRAPQGEILSYSYNRYSVGHLYQNYGFELMRENKTTLYYWHEEQLKNRNLFMKYKVAKMLGVSPKDPRTEAQLAEEVGAYQLFGSGTRAWVLTREAGPSYN